MEPERVPIMRPSSGVKPMRGVDAFAVRNRGNRGAVSEMADDQAQRVRWRV